MRYAALEARGEGYWHGFLPEFFCVKLGWVWVWDADVSGVRLCSRYY